MSTQTCPSIRCPTCTRRAWQFTVNSDDPPLFGTTLNDEVTLLADPFGLNLSAIDEILLNAVRHSFLPAPEKEYLKATFRAELDALKVTHLAALIPDRA